MELALTIAVGVVFTIVGFACVDKERQYQRDRERDDRGEEQELR